MRNPAVPQAGSQMMSLGVGAVISTISLMMCRGVRNCPFCPAEAILPSMYSYRSPLVSLVGHVDRVELIDHVGQHARRGHHEQRILHVMRVGAGPLGIVVAVGAEGLDEGEDLLLHRLEHLFGRGLLEARPAERILLFVEDRVFDGFAGAGGLVLLERLEFVEALDEEQVGELFDDGERVGDAAGPHGVPDAIDFGFEFAGDHCFPTVGEFRVLLSPDLRECRAAFHRGMRPPSNECPARAHPRNAKRVTSH